MSVSLFPELSDEQQMLLDATAAVLESACPLPAVRELAERSGPSDPALRRKLASLGSFGMLVHERYGGGSVCGNGVVDAALIAAERGARVQPGPFVGANIVAYTLSEAGAGPETRDALAGILSGDAAATWAFGGWADSGEADSRLRARPADGGFLLSGTVKAVQDADECRWVLLSALAGETAAHYLVPLPADGLTVRRCEGLDVTRRFCELRLDDVRVPETHAITHAETARRLLDRQIALAAVLSAAESVGAMDADFRLAVEYAKLRVAFGRPIGSFQGIKHRLADTSLLLEMSKALVAGAAAALGRGDDDGMALASIAKAFVSERSVELTHNCFQVFGGIGYTWEHDHHLFMRRLASEAYLFGTPSWHRERLWRLADAGAEHAGRANA